MNRSIPLFIALLEQLHICQKYGYNLGNENFSMGGG
jgi:hypothetical protein